MNRVTVTASIYHAALAFAGTKDVRYYLNGVRVEHSPDGNGVILIATDGHALAVLHDAAGSISTAPDTVTGLDRPGEPVILPRLKLAAGERRQGMTIEFTGHYATTSSGLSVPAAYVDGHYPDWRAIVPSHNSIASEEGQPFIDTELLARLESMRGGYGAKYCGAAVHGFGAERACLVTFGDAVPAFVVIMPLRVTGRSGSAAPSFMTRAVPMIEAASQ